MFDYSKLRGRIIEKYGSIMRFAEDTSTSQPRVSNILNDKAYLNQTEIIEWSDLLDIPHDDIALYFFCPRT